MARPRSEEARLRTIEATIDTLLEHGAEGLTMEEIAERSGVAKSTIYRHFGTREHLVNESVRWCVVEQPTPDSGSLADDLTDLFTRYDESEETKRLNELIPLLIDGARRDADMREVLDALLVKRQRPLRTVLKLAQGRGEIDRDLDLDVAVAVLIGPFTYRRIVQDAEITDEFIAAVVQTGIAALRSTAAGTD
jgi:AcrR family transcriptional regulator